MPVYIGLRARLNFGRHYALSKAFSMCYNHTTCREKDSYFEASNNNYLKVKQQENILDGEKSIMLLRYHRDQCPKSGITSTKSKLIFSANTDDTDCLEKCYADHTFHGIVEKVRDEFFVLRNGYTVTIIVDKLNRIGDYFQVKIPVTCNQDITNAKWLAKRICFEFNVAPKDIFSTPRCYFDLLTESEIHSQRHEVHIEVLAKMNRIKRERIIHDKLAKYNDFIKRKKRNFLRIQQRRRQWRRRQAIRVRQVMQSKGVKASTVLKRARAIKKVKVEVKACVKQAEVETREGRKSDMNLKEEGKVEDEEEVQVLAHYSKGTWMTW